MPTYAQMDLPTPKDWDEFEHITYDVLSNRWGVKLNRHGRQGQPQNGVDIYGTKGQECIGIQCKRYENTLTEKMIQEEIIKAQSFLPKIQSFYIATTTRRDARIQKYIREYNSDTSKSFNLDVFFWEDIQSFLSEYENLISKHYPQIYRKNNTTVKKNNDIRQLEYIFSGISLNNFQDMLIFSPITITYKLYEDFQKIINRIGKPLFFLEERMLQENFQQWYEAYNELIKLIDQARSIEVEGYRDRKYLYEWLAGDNFLEKPERLSFAMFGDCCASEHQKIYDQIQDSSHRFIKKNQEFCVYLVRNYPELDLKLR